MGNISLFKPEKMPVMFDDFFKPWNEWFDSGSSLFNRMLTVPAVNIVENKNDYVVSMSVPGFKKEDFKINVESNMLTISSEKEVSKEEKESKYTRKEYSYSSFSRSFTIPEEVNQERIEAIYEDGILNLFLPRKEAAKKVTAKNIAVK